MADERHPSTLVEVLQGLGKGLQELSRSPAFAALVEAELDYKAKKERNERPAIHVQELFVQDDGIVCVEGFEEPIDLLRLRRTIGNVARSLTRYSNWVKDDRSTTPAVARNHLARATGAMNALSGLLKADELSSPFWDAAEAMQSDKWISNAVEGEDTVVVFHEQGQEHLALTLAEVYRRIKNLKNTMANSINTHYRSADIQGVVSQLEVILLHISENADIKTIKTNGGQDG